MRAFLTSALCAFFAVLSGSGSCAARQEPVVLQVSSEVSGSPYTPAEIIRVCRNNGIRVVVLAERDLMKWEYGIWPLRGLVKKTVEERSLLRYGVRRYLDEIRSLREANPDMLILAGVESAPYYYWSGNPFDGTLVINDWHRHIISFGFRGEKDYLGLPVTGNPAGKGFDPYQGDLGPRPYQRYADYAAQRGALTFWSHPDAENREDLGKIRSETGDYSELLARVDGYTGFFIFYEGYRRTGLPEGVWDEILLDYCAGRRKWPVWAAAGLAVDAEGGLDERLKTLRTMVEMEDFSEEALLSAMKAGKMYVVYGKDAPQFRLEKFSAICSGKEAPLVEINAVLRKEEREHAQVILIRNGRQIRVFDLDGPEVSVSMRDDEAPAGKGYYRIEINSRGVKVIANPVFYERKPL